jgi:hypothetical protein
MDRLVLLAKGDHVPPLSIVLSRTAAVGVTRLSKTRAVPVRRHGGLQACEMLRIPNCLNNQLTDGGKVVSPWHRPRSTPQEHYFSASGTVRG